MWNKRGKKLFQTELFQQKIFFLFKKAYVIVVSLTCLHVFSYYYFSISFQKQQPQQKGYSPHPNYGMVVPPDYSSNSYSSYGSAAAVAAAAAAAAAAYQCGATNSNSSSVNPYTNAVIGPAGVGYQGIPVSGGSMNAGNCYTMPPPQHLPQLDKNGSKDR